MIYGELKDLGFDELVRRLSQPSPDGEAYSFSYFGEVALALRELGPEGVEFLVQQLDSPDEARLGAVLFALSAPPLSSVNVKGVLSQFLDDPRPLVVAEAVEGLRRTGDIKVRDKVVAHLESHSPYVRGAVLRYLRHCDGDEAVPVLIQSLRDNHYIVRQSAADELGEAGVREALPYLRSLLEDPHPHVRQAAQTAIDFIEDAY